ncbi:MAG: LapA family protein, partial [Azonexus sp.]|nr:LapA family protein [Azonexus sp.]
QFEGSLALVFLLAMLLGALIVGLLSTPATLRRQWRGYRKTRQIRDLEAERRQLLAEIEALRRQRQAGATVDVLPEASEKRLALPPHEAV